jgi:hypothetical protein
MDRLYGSRMEDLEARRARLEELHRLAAAVSQELPGLDVESATLSVASHPGLSIRFAGRNEPITADFRYGRITATTQEGVVVDAVIG